MRINGVNALLLALIALASPGLPQSPSPGEKTKGPSANPARRVAVPAERSVETILVAKEKEVWEAVKKKDNAALANLLADDAVATFGAGLLRKPEILKWVNRGTIRDCTTANMKVMVVERDSALVVYDATEKSWVDGRERAKPVRIASFWVKRSGKWLNAYHQERPPD